MSQTKYCCSLEVKIFTPSRNVGLAALLIVRITRFSRELVNCARAGYDFYKRSFDRDLSCPIFCVDRFQAYQLDPLVIFLLMLCLIPQQCAVCRVSWCSMFSFFLTGMPPPRRMSGWVEVWRRNLSACVALNARFTTNGMCATNNTIYMWREQAIIEWSRWSDLGAWPRVMLVKLVTSW